MRKRSVEEAQEALKDLVGLKKNEETDYGKGGSINKTPDRSIDVPTGVRIGQLMYIDTNINDEFKFIVYFPETNTEAYACRASELGVQWTPNGQWNGKRFAVSGTVMVYCQAIKDTLKWQIIGVKENPNIISGTTLIERDGAKIRISNEGVYIEKGESSITVSNGHVLIENEGTKLDVKNDWVYINNKKICVEPCGGAYERFIWASGQQIMQS